MSAPTAHRTATKFTTLTSWRRRDWLEAGGLLGFVVALHVIGFGLLFFVIAPNHYSVGTQIFGVGLGITAYTFGLRHAFDADHIAAIDNTTRKLRGDGIRPKAVGFWFAMGHATIVFILAFLVVAGAHAVGALMDENSTAHETLGMIGTLSSGAFLWVIGILNLLALIGIYRVWQGLRRGEFDEHELEGHLANRGFLARMLSGLTATIRRPWQMYPLGLLFGLGFDTASEVALLVLAGSSAAAGVPWYAIIVLPLLFAAGMSLLDTLDGLFMSVAYDWAFLKPVRKVYYNLAITALSVTVALLIGTIEIVAVLHDAGWTNPVTDWVAGLDLNNVGFLVVGLFVLVWTVAITYWNLAKVEDRWGPQPLAPDSTSTS
ncbi:MAG: HoxN/HupN/NixA family nickel/cobalt transporter [Nostocoides sp.]